MSGTVPSLDTLFYLIGQSVWFFWTPRSLLPLLLVLSALWFAFMWYLKYKDYVKVVVPSFVQNSVRRAEYGVQQSVRWWNNRSSHTTVWLKWYTHAVLPLLPPRQQLRRVLFRLVFWGPVTYWGAPACSFLSCGTPEFNKKRRKYTWRRKYLSENREGFKKLTRSPVARAPSLTFCCDILSCICFYYLHLLYVSISYVKGIKRA